MQCGASDVPDPNPRLSSREYHTVSAVRVAPFVARCLLPAYVELLLRSMQLSGRVVNLRPNLPAHNSSHLFIFGFGYCVTIQFEITRMMSLSQFSTFTYLCTVESSHTQLPSHVPCISIQSSEAPHSRLPGYRSSHVVQRRDEEAPSG